MSLLKMLGSGDAIAKLASQLNMDPEKAKGLASMLAPAIGSAAKKRAESSGIGGMEGLMGELRGEGNASYFDAPETAASPKAMSDGENFLERILGSRDATKELTAEAATRSGVDKAEVEQFLPALAAMLKGGMQKQTPDKSIDGMMAQLTGGGGGASGGSGGGGILSAVTSMLSGGGSSDGGKDSGGGLDMSSLFSMLDADGDGSPLDDILARVMK